MNRIVSIFVVVILAVCVMNQILFADEESKNIVVEIDYGDIRPSRTVNTSYREGMSALELLQTVSKVETHPVDQYIFVVSIDGVYGKRGDMAWYYTVDGKSADKLAYLNPLNNAKRIKWVYKKDTCSEKVDKPPHQ